MSSLGIERYIQRVGPTSRLRPSARFGGSGDPFNGLVALLAWTYAGLLALWWVLHLTVGDLVWWVALVSVFAPYLFAPLAALVPLGLIARRPRYWAAILLAVALFLAEYGAPLTARAAAGAESGDALTVLTFNVWGYSDSAETARVIVSQGTPDVVLLQELSPGLVPVLEQELGALYPYRLLNPGEGYTGGGVLSRYPLRPARMAVDAQVDGFAQVVEVEADARVLTLYNVHLEATAALHYIDAGEPVGRRVRDSFALRERQVELLVRDLARREGPVLVAGDWNMTEQSDAYRALTRELRDAHREAGRGFGHSFPAYAGRFQPTVGLSLPIFPRLVRIDIILHSPDWTAVECRVLPAHGQSDHLPVWARLAWAL